MRRTRANLSLLFISRSGRWTRKFTTRSQTYGFGNDLSEKSLKKFWKSLLQNSYRSNFLIRGRIVLFFGHPLTGTIAIFYIFKCPNFTACNGIRFKRFLFFSRQSVVDRLTTKRSLRDSLASPLSLSCLYYESTLAAFTLFGLRNLFSAFLSHVSSLSSLSGIIIILRSCLLCTSVRPPPRSHTVR